MNMEVLTLEMVSPMLILPSCFSVNENIVCISLFGRGFLHYIHRNLR